MFQSGRLRSFRKTEVDCKCSHPRVCHYTKEGNCVYQACECKEFSSKGRAEFRNVKRSRCELGHSHDSGLEIKQCFELFLQKQAGQIKDFRFHQIVDLPGPSGRVVARYEIDFTIDHCDGTTEWIECKGDHLIREMGWRIKWALLMDKHHGDPLHKFRVVRG